MPRAILLRAARALYGDDWQSPLARHLGVSLRTVQRWASGISRPPDLRAQLAALCRERAVTLRGTALALDRLARDLDAGR
jgi:hypothetical protein